MEHKQHYAERQSGGAQRERPRLRLIAAVGFGNFLENFDFTVYSYFATIIGLVILKTDDPLFSTYISSILFGLGFLARPAGSILIGAYADKYGRKAALLITIMLMGLGSACIAFAPPYALIGLGAPLMILAGRLLQGFSAGGEIGSAAALLMESAAPSRRGLFMACQFMTQGISAAFGALFAYLLYKYIAPEQMRLWGWRVPFIFALLIIPAGLYIRRAVAETYAGESDKGDKTAPKKAAHPLRLIWRQRRRQFLLAVMMVMPVTVSVYILVLFMPTYLNLLAETSGAAFLGQGSSRFAVTAGSGLLMAAAAFGGGLLCDRLKRRKILALVCILLLFFSSFFTYFCVKISFIGFCCGLAASVALLGVLMTVQALMVAEAFPRSVRVSGLAVSIAAGACLFGGTAQVIVTKIMIMANLAPLSPFYYLGAVLLLSLAVYAAFREDYYL